MNCLKSRKRYDEKKEREAYEKRIAEEKALYEKMTDEEKAEYDKRKKEDQERGERYLRLLQSIQHQPPYGKV